MSTAPRREFAWTDVVMCETRQEKRKKKAPRRGKRMDVCMIVKRKKQYKRMRIM